MNTRVRNPDGLERAKPIALRLMPDERAEHERVADLLGYTMSYLAREAYLAGLPLVTATLPPTGVCSGEFDRSPEPFVQDNKGKKGNHAE